MFKKNGFCEMNMDETLNVSGGGIIGEMSLFIPVVGGAMVAGFNIGRQLVKDIRSKWF